MRAAPLRHRRTVLELVLATILTATLAPAPLSAQAPDRWEKAIAAFEAADKTNPPPKDCVLFIGASNTRRWSTLAQDFRGWKVVNRGFGGSLLSDALHFADRIVIPAAPKTICVQSGGNDINAGRTPDQVLADFKAFVLKVRATLPETKIHFIALPPSPARWSQREKQREVNRLVETFAREDGQLNYIDVFEHMLGDDGRPRPELYVSDNLHLSPKGYSLWTSLIRWDSALKNFAKNARTNPPPADPVLFIGSSSVVRWKTLAQDFPGLPVVNRGFGGSLLADSANLVHHLVLPLRPGRIVVYAGSNDINAGRTPEQVLAAFQSFVEKVHAKQSETAITFISITPAPSRWKQVEQIKAANKLVEDFCRNHARLTFIDAFEQFLGPDGQPREELFVEDRLHLAPAGYAIWQALVSKSLTK
jgi:lysophospholipase L1-like esterase